MGWQKRSEGSILILEAPQVETEFKKENEDGSLELVDLVRPGTGHEILVPKALL